MNDIITAMLGSVGAMGLFGFAAFAVWINYRKEKDQRDARHQERMRALELGHPPLDAEIERARAYASAAWAAGLIGLLVPLVVVLLAVIGTIVAVVHHDPGENIGGPLIVAWSIACVLSLVAIVLSLNVIRRLPRPTADVPARSPIPDKRGDPGSGEFQEKRLEL